MGMRVAAIELNLSIIAPIFWQDFVYRVRMKEFPHLAQALSNTIEALRKDRKMTKSALAEFAWLERRYLLEIEQGEKKPTVNAVYSICEALGIPPLAFFTRVEEERKRLSCLDNDNGNPPDGEPERRHPQ